jgi:hypothetical protein
MVRTRIGLRIPNKIAPTLMANTKQWNIPAATDIADTDKFSGSHGPNIGDDRTFSWTLIKTKLTAFFSTSFAALQNQINALVTPAVYAAPVANISATPVPGAYEIGTVIDAVVTTSLQQNDSGGPTTGTPVKILRNGTQVATVSPFDFGAFTMDSAGLTARSTIDFLGGPVKNNNVGVPSPNGQIQAGSAPSQTLSWIGSYAVMYGPMTNGDDFGDITDLRTEPGVAHTVTYGMPEVTINTGTVAKRFIVAIPAGKTVDTVIDLDALGANVTSQYTVKALADGAIKDAAGVPVNGYNIFGMAQAVPYGTSHRHLVTFKAG